MNDTVKQYDLAIAYRIYPKVAAPATGLPFSDDKYRLADVCLQSLRSSLGTLRAKIWVLLDGCPPQYTDLFQKYFDPKDLVLVPLPGIGNFETFKRQVDILLTQDDAELVYFAEDDYFYLPGQFHLMTDFIQAYSEVDFVTPIDHPDCYTLDLHRKPEWLRVFEDHHWRTAASTCLTFLTTRSVLKQTAQVFRGYSNLNFDCSLWFSLTKNNLKRPIDFLHWAVREPVFAKILARAWRFGFGQIVLGKRYRLWGPMPGIATHMDATRLSPTIDWPTKMQEQARPASEGAVSEPRDEETAIVFKGEATSCAEAGRIWSAFQSSLALDNKLPDRLLDLPGMSGRKYRRFINRLVHETPDAGYLEIGCWTGSTTCAAIAGNTVRVICIDNWSEFGGPKAEFQKNIESVLSRQTDFRFIESDLRSVDYRDLGTPLNIYLFDGPHQYQDQYDGIVIAQPALADIYVLVVDDWNWPFVRHGTQDALRALGMEVPYSIEIRTTQSDRHPVQAGPMSDWHNGYFFAVCKKAQA
jgi:Methyltransferase domain